MFSIKVFTPKYTYQFNKELGDLSLSVRMLGRHTQKGGETFTLGIFHDVPQEYGFPQITFGGPGPKSWYEGIMLKSLKGLKLLKEKGITFDTPSGLNYRQEAEALEAFIYECLKEAGQDIESQPESHEVPEMSKEDNERVKALTEELYSGPEITDADLFGDATDLLN